MEKRLRHDPGAGVASRVAALSYRPGLAVVLVGDDPASLTYVRNKDRAAALAGIDVQTLRMPADTAQIALLERIETLNADPAIDGILVQLPLPPHIDVATIVEAVDPAKDVDGFHPVNVGRLASGRPALVPCTPLGVMRLLEQANVPIGGASGSGVGAVSSLVAAAYRGIALLAADTTVTIAHSQTREPGRECRRSGDPDRGHWAGRSWCRPTGSRPGATRRSMWASTVRADGWSATWLRRMREVAGAITPVPGGVGPMYHRTCLLENTVEAAERRRAGIGPAVAG